MAKPLNISLEVKEGPPASFFDTENVENEELVPASVSDWAKKTGNSIPEGVGNEEVVLVSIVVPKAAVYQSKNKKSYLNIVAFEAKNNEYNSHSIKASLPSELSEKVKGTYKTHPEFSNFFCPFLGNIKKPKEASNSAPAASFDGFSGDGGEKDPF